MTVNTPLAGGGAVAADRSVGSGDASLLVLAAVNAHDAHLVADCFTADDRSEVPHRPAESFVGSDRVAENWTVIFARLPDVHAQMLGRAVAGSVIWAEWELAATDAPDAPVLLCGPVILTTRAGRSAWARFYISPTTPSPAP